LKIENESVLSFLRRQKSKEIIGFEILTFEGMTGGMENLK
jgi:hypothetical protein